MERLPFDVTLLRKTKQCVSSPSKRERRLHTRVDEATVQDQHLIKGTEL